MSRREDNIKDLLNEFRLEQRKFREEQNRFKEEQNVFKTEQNVFKEEQKKLNEDQKSFNEKQIVFNEKVNVQNKKNKRAILIMMLVCLFVSGISSVLSYTLGASSVEYTPRDSNWKVENTQEAIDDLFNSVGAALVGSVYSYMGVTAPYGYLACDGSIYNIDDYPRLASHINRSFGSYNYFGGDGTNTFAVPDLRGEFLRGTGNNSHSYQGSGSTVGIHQDGTVIPIVLSDSENTYVTSASNFWSGTVSYDYSYSSNGRYARILSKNQIYQSQYSENTRIVARPTNTSVLYIIKY